MLCNLSVSKNLTLIVQILLLLGTSFAVAATVDGGATGSIEQPKEFRIWAFGDSHVSTDAEQGRESLADALLQSEMGGADGGPPFEWDIAINLGDFAGGFGVPHDNEGAEIVRQYSVMKKHRREQIYSIAGNHDATLHTETPRQWWFRKWIDPMGENTQYSGVDAAKRPYKTEGTWERYSFRVGNLLFLMMSDRNDLPPPVGRGKIDSKAQVGGYPAGAVTEDTFSWWQQLVESNPETIVISGHHHMLKDTTTGSGAWEGFTRNDDGSWRNLYHGYTAGGAPEGASYLYWLGDKPDAQAFEKFLAANNNAIDVWLGAHTHLSPARNTGNKHYMERKWGVNFINVAALSKYHNPLIVPPSSRLLTFTEGSDQLKVQYYLHTRDYYYQGWYPNAEMTIQLSKSFSFSLD
jgi:hypothetical protein